MTWKPCKVLVKLLAKFLGNLRRKSLSLKQQMVQDMSLVVVGNLINQNWDQEPELR